MTGVSILVLEKYEYNQSTSSERFGGSTALMETDLI